MSRNVSAGDRMGTSSRGELGTRLGPRVLGDRLNDTRHALSTWFGGARVCARARASSSVRSIARAFGSVTMFSFCVHDELRNAQD